MLLDVVVLLGFTALVGFFTGAIIFLGQIHRQNKYIEQLQQRLEQEKQTLEKEKTYLYRSLYDDKPYDGFGG